MQNKSDPVRFGPWYLGYDLRKAYDENLQYKLYDTPKPIREILSELTGEELQDFRSAGARPEYDDERLYEGYEALKTIGVTYLGLAGWDFLLATHKGLVYKIALTYQAPKSYLDYVEDKISQDLSASLGKPKKKVFDRAQKVWEADGVRVRVMVRNLPGHNLKQVNLIAKYSEE